MGRIPVYKISPSTELSMQQEPYRNFINSLDSEDTRKSYRHSLDYFMKFLKVETYEQLLNYEHAKLEGIVRDFIIYLKQDKKASPATISLRLAALTHFYEMNDISLRWKKLKKFKSKFRNVVEDQPYTRDQIKKLVGAAPLRDKAMILLMASSGIRRGAITFLRLKDMERIDKYNLLKFRIYKNEQESYTTYCTPECAEIIDQYMRWRERLGEKFTPNTPLFRLSFDTILAANRPKPIRPRTISRRINQLLQDAEIRVPVTGNSTNRSELMETHGFRKFFKTTCINTGMNPLYSEYLMGHKSGLTKSYFKPSDMELLEGNEKALGYVAAINDLTINEENRLHKKIDELTKKKDEIELMEIKHNQEIKAIRDQMNQIISMIQQNPKLAHVKPNILLEKRTHR